MVASDGYSYEEAAIQQWCQRATDTDPVPGRARSHHLPMTNLELESLTLRPNIALRAATQTYIEQRPELRLKPPKTRD